MILKPLNVPVRFFIYNAEEGDIYECSEGEFIDCPFPIKYERHTVSENGVSQICLTKMEEF